MSDIPAGFDAMSKYPLFEALFKRRSRRISIGLQSVPAGSNSYQSNAKPQPLWPLPVRPGVHPARCAVVSTTARARG